MATPIWSPGKVYAPGALVVPRTQAAIPGQAIANAGFETGSTGWSLAAGWAATTAGVAGRAAYAGDGFATFTGSGEGTIVEATGHACKPAQSITAACYLRSSGSGSTANALILLAWYDATNTFISTSTASASVTRTNGVWRQSTITATAPAGAAFVRAGASVTITSDGGYFDVDEFTWNYVPPGASVLQYKAVQASPAASGGEEPAWPTTVGGTVFDGGVTWQAVLMSRVVWQARSLLVSGDTEPEWPTEPGAFVSDGSISWEAVSRRVEDENCPTSKVTAILASKVFKADRDIVRFSATANPLDWTTAEDAGYLPTGLQQANANDMAVLQPYRGHLAAYNASSFQNWQVDPDPQLMTLLDQMDGVGSTWQHAAQAVGDELFYLSQLGVRTVGIASAAENLSAGDVGMPVDPLVQAAVRTARQTYVDPLATYYPSAGQYWLAFPPPELVACNLQTEYTGGQSFPSVINIDLGTGTGEVTLSFDAFHVADKWEVWYDGEKVIDTGYRGHDPGGWQAALDAALAARGLPPEEIVSPGNGTATFTKEAPYPTHATVRVYAPLSVTAWEFTLGCPDGEPPAQEGTPTTEVFVYSMTRVGRVGAWSRYVFPYSIQAFAQLGNDLYIRQGNEIVRVSEEADTDQRAIPADNEAGWVAENLPFTGHVWWPYLDIGAPGITKMLESIDYVGTGGAPQLSIGVDQRDEAAFTEPFEIVNDTMPGTPIPFPLAAPTFSVRLDFDSSNGRWQVQSVVLTTHPFGGQP